MHIYADERPAQRHVSVLTEGGTMYGHVQLIVWNVYRKGRIEGDHYACIEDVWVHEDHRGKGYGRQLLRHAKQTAQSLGVRRVYLTARDTDERTAARKLYESEGFVQSTDGFTWENPGLQETEEST